MLIALCADDLGTPFGPFVRMLIVTGQRRNEVSEMNWSEVDRITRLWTIPKERSKNKCVHKLPLNDIAIAGLDELAEGENWPATGLVFTTTGRTSISGYSRVKKRLDDIIGRVSGEPISPWRLHDLRRTFATNMQRLGVRFEVTEALLNHVGDSKAGVAGVYQRHDWEPEKADAVRLWANRLLELLANFEAEQASR
jgi:integrase